MGKTYEEECRYGRILRVPISLVQIDGSAQEGHFFAKERENILYSVAFRNLSSKTQVFHTDFNANLRTRLTHTLEVSRIAADMAEALGFDVNLVETIALGHDLGHTPFGHVGERAIHKFSTGEDRKYTTRDGKTVQVPEELCGFKHNLQSVRLLVDYTQGCEFSNFVLYGIRGHSSLEYHNFGINGKTSFYGRYEKKCSIILDDGKAIPAWSIEAFLVKWADEIAQRHHDIEDAYYQRIMSPIQIVNLLKNLNELVMVGNGCDLFSEMKKIAENFESANDEKKELFLRHLTEFAINTYVHNIIAEFQKCFRELIKKYEIVSNDTFAKVYTEIDEKEVKDLFSLKDSAIGKVDSLLNRELKYAILDSSEVQRLDGKSMYIIRRLLRAYKSNPQQLPNRYINRLMQKEIYEILSDQERGILLEEIKKRLDYNITDEAIKTWQNYECRNALRVLLEELHTEQKILPALMRVVFDYIASMTDDFAYEEYKELYE